MERRIGLSSPTVRAVKAGSQVLSATFTLPSGGPTRAIRSQFRYMGYAGTCVSSSYNDRDDLIFSVATATTDAGAMVDQASMRAQQ